jgi:4-hydroxy-tetrahydrodipicolinate reductase
MSEGLDKPLGSEIRVILFGVGAIGGEIARLLLRRKGVKIVGAVDAAPDKVGRDLGDVIGLGKKLDVMVLKSLDDLNVKADIAIHATTSFLKNAYPQIAMLIKRGLNVISTCEELSYPYIVNKEIAKEIDELARRYSVTVLGTGINPGFVMDTLVITLTAACQEIRCICAERAIDAAKRRLPFQKKIGVGLRLEDFKEKASKGEITGHIGLGESIAMIANSLGWRLDEIREDPIEPIIPNEEVKSKFMSVEPGLVTGLTQKAYGIISGEPKVTLIFKAYLGAKEEYDSIMIDGEPVVYAKISPCIHGDKGTAAVIVNSILNVINAPPGLKTMKDLQVPSAFLGDFAYNERSYK